MSLSLTNTCKSYLYFHSHPTADDPHAVRLERPQSTASVWLPQARPPGLCNCSAPTSFPALLLYKWLLKPGARRETEMH